MSGIGPVGGGSLNPSSIKAEIERSSSNQAEKVEKVGQQFEAVLLRQYLGDALKPMFKGYIDEGGSVNSTYRYFITDVLAESMSESGGFGMGEQLSAQINSGMKGVPSQEPSLAISDKNSSKIERPSDIRSLKPLSQINGTANAKQ